MTYQREGTTPSAARMALVLIALIVAIGALVLGLAIAWLTLKPITFLIVIVSFTAWAVFVVRFTR